MKTNERKDETLDILHKIIKTSEAFWVLTVVNID
jgi:ribosomal protein L10